MADLEALQARIRAQGTRAAILDLHADAAHPVLKRGGCMYGVFAKDAGEAVVRERWDTNELSFGVEDAVG